MYPPYPPPFSYQWETKDLRAESLYQMGNIGVSGKKAVEKRKSPGKADQNGNMRGNKMYWESVADDSQAIIAGMHY